VQEQDGEKGPLLQSAERKCLVMLDDLERPQDPELHLASSGGR
jgi:hypothetical protein